MCDIICGKSTQPECTGIDMMEVCPVFFPISLQLRSWGIINTLFYRFLRLCSMTVFFVPEWSEASCSIKRNFSVWSFPNDFVQSCKWGAFLSPLSLWYHFPFVRCMLFFLLYIPPLLYSFLFVFVF